MLIVFNPTAGRRRAHLLWRVLDILVANGCRLEIAETTRAGDAEAFARAANRDGASLVVAAGGDGTIAEVARGLVGSRTRLGIIPLGTANVLAHELALPFSPRLIASALAFGRTRPLWPGVARGGGEERLFVQMLSVGFDASVVHRISARLKRTLGRGAYVYQTLRELPRYEFPPIRLAIDNGDEIEAGGVIVSKGRYYGGKYVLASDARSDEPGFSVALFERSGPFAALMYGAALPLNRLGSAPGVRCMRARKIEFRSNQPLLAQSDGDAVGWLPSVVGDAATSIDVVISQ